MAYLFIFVTTMIFISAAILDSNASLKPNVTSVPLPDNGHVLKMLDVVEQNLSLVNSTTCRFDVSSEAVAQFAEVLSSTGGVVFVVVTIHFTNESEHIYANATNIINPHNFFWALDGKGALLLTYPAKFESLSMGTLSPGVYNNFSLDVVRPDDGCFERASDSAKEFIQTSFVVDLARAAIESLTVNQDLYAETGFRVCIRKLGQGFKLTNDLLTILLSYHVEYDCMSVNASLEPVSPGFHKIRKEAWLYFLRYVGFVVALFTPVWGLLFTHGKLPLVKRLQDKMHNLANCESTEICDETRETYLALDSILPTGIRYLLLHSCENSNTVFLIRCSIAIFTITYIPTMYVCHYTHLSHSDITSLANSTRDIFLDSKSSMFIILCVTIFTFSSLLLLLLHILGSSEPRRTIHRMLNFNDSDLQKLTIVPWITIQRRRPLPLLEGPTVKRFLLQLSARTWMALDPSIWDEWPTSVLLHFNKGKLSRKQLEAKFKNRYIWGFFVKQSLRLVLVPLLLFSSIPLVNMFNPVVIEIIRIVRRREKISLTGILGILFCGVGAIMVFYTSTVLLIISFQTVAYTFIGILLNHDSVGKVAMALAIIIVFITSRCSTFSSKYYVLLRKLIDKAQEIDNDHQNKELEDHPLSNLNTNEICVELPIIECKGTDGDPTYDSRETNFTEGRMTSQTRSDNKYDLINQYPHPDNTIASNCEEDKSVSDNSKFKPEQNLSLPLKRLLPVIGNDNMAKENARVQSSNEGTSSRVRNVTSLIYLKSNLPHVSLHLYNKCVERYLPIYMKVTKLGLEFALFVTVITLSVQTLKSIEDVNEIPEVADYFLIAVIPALIPLFASLLFSDARMEAEEEAKWQTLGSFLEDYRKQLLHDPCENEDGICNNTNEKHEK